MPNTRVNRTPLRLRASGTRRRVYNQQRAARRNLFPDPTNNGNVDDALRPLVPEVPRPPSPDIDIEGADNPGNQQLNAGL